METINLINALLRIFLITFFIFLTYGKITNYKNKNIHYIFIFIVSIDIALIYIILNNYIPTFFTTIILYILYVLIINKIMKSKLNIFGYLYACLVSYVIYLLAIILSGIILFVMSNKRQYATPINLITIPVSMYLLFLLIFKRKRLKNGFNFLKNNGINKSVKIFSVFSIGVIIVIFLGYPRKIDNLILNACLLLGSLGIVFNLIIWIKSQITKTYKNKMRDRTIEIQKTEIDEQARVMEELKAENIKLATAIHKYNKKFSSLEFAMKNALKLETNTEFANELSVILEETKESSENFAKETEVNTNKLPLTNITGIDNMFKYMQEEARKKNINFDLKLNTSINPLVDNMVSKDKFETLIGDHLKDAIIAVNASKTSYKSILVTLGLVEGIYEFSVYDTGIEFEIETLLKLGEEQVTTHKDEGGSGIGFMTTFETLKECKASLVIEEYNPETTNYTKSVTIRFDGKNEYKICSYRAEKIKEQKHKRRIIIEKLK